jgi:hypothetical protein
MASKKPSLRGQTKLVGIIDDAAFFPRFDSSHGESRIMTDETKTTVDTSDERIAVICMLVSNPDGLKRPDDWRKQVNDVLRALRDERNALKRDIDNLENDALERS